MGRKKGGSDWEDAELEYLNSRISLKDLAEKRQISYSAVQRRAVRLRRAEPQGYRPLETYVPEPSMCRARRKLPAFLYS